MFGFITIAVAPFGEYWAPTPASTCSTSSWRAASIVRRRVDPGTTGFTSWTDIGCPIASLTTRRRPSCPRSCWL